MGWILGLEFSSIFFTSPLFAFSFPAYPRIQCMKQMVSRNKYCVAEHTSRALARLTALPGATTVIIVPKKSWKRRERDGAHFGRSLLSQPPITTRRRGAVGGHLSALFVSRLGQRKHESEFGDILFSKINQPNGICNTLLFDMFMLCIFGEHSLMHTGCLSKSRAAGCR